MLLAGDIGGTNSRLAIFDLQFQQIHQSVTPNAGRTSFTEIVREFLTSAPPDAVKQIRKGCFGIAGPVAGGKVTLTNLSWQLDEVALAKDLGLDRVSLINDLVAHAEGIELLKPEQLVQLNVGEAAAEGNRAIIAAGTGLGEAGLVWSPTLNGYRAFASEGGHSDFAPRTDQEIALLRFLQQTKKLTATWETVLSGPGLRNIYDFMISPDQLGAAAALQNPNPAPFDIAKAAMENSNRAAFAAMDLLVHFYGAEAGNLALKLLAVGGVYLGGGIAPRIIDKLKSPAFLDAFFSKGPEKMRPMLRKIPVYIINFDLNGLYGAANVARRL
ncbi:MAG TPA: glucokinase [Tepidisphaeraceae bacterium]|jgi:glucokinase|nr:glucokinase [Tepidisphaeraceae bacterium]